MISNWNPSNLTVRCGKNKIDLLKIGVLQCATFYPLWCLASSLCIYIMICKESGVLTVTDF